MKPRTLIQIGSNALLRCQKIRMMETYSSRATEGRDFIATGVNVSLGGQRAFERKGERNICTRTTETPQRSISLLRRSPGPLASVRLKANPIWLLRTNPTQVRAAATYLSF